METTGDVFIKGNEEGVQTQLTSLKQRLESAKAEITAIKEEMATLLKAEINPQVGTVTDGKWCTANAGQVECTQEAPLLSFTETDPQVGTVTDGKWCVGASGGQVARRRRRCCRSRRLTLKLEPSLMGSDVPRTPGRWSARRRRLSPPPPLVPCWVSALQAVMVMVAVVVALLHLQYACLKHATAKMVTPR